MMQTQIHFQQQLTEISRRCHILQDWMMSPFRLVPMQVLQDSTLHIDQLHDFISTHPSDDDPWSVQLLKLLDHSIAAHFPHFDFPRWDLLNPEIPSDFEGKKTYLLRNMHNVHLESPLKETKSPPRHMCWMNVYHHLLIRYVKRMTKFHPLHLQWKSIPVLKNTTHYQEQGLKSQMGMKLCHLHTRHCNKMMICFWKLLIKKIHKCWKELTVLQSPRLHRELEDNQHGKQFQPMKLKGVTPSP